MQRRRSTHADSSIGGGTSVVTAADTAGNAIVLVHSNSFQRYGSGIVVAPYGLVLSNRPGRGFTDDPSHPNFPAPGRRPVTTLHAWAAETPDGSLLLVR
ncbi:MAG: gamma-glutamyltransferase [Pseudonocardia sp.]|nr:gamma-glutamyltransferase [Pseudonocardia sp.]